MNNLPNNTWLTMNYCNRFSGIIVVDGKYIKVKGYHKKIPFIYGIDYLKHDLPVGILSPSENEESFRRYFRLLKTCNYPLQVVICDDILPALKPGLLHYYPKAKIQLCHNHYLENIRQKTRIRTEEQHQLFFHKLNEYIFKSKVENKKNKEELNKSLHHIFTKYARNNLLRQSVLIDIYKKEENLFTYQNIPHCPRDTNLIELFNSHLNARLTSIKGFKSFKNAERFLNAYLIRRRTKRYTDCSQKFKYLNGKYPLELTIKKQANMPEIISKYQPDSKR
jgi:transposase-like protein